MFAAAAAVVGCWTNKSLLAVPATIVREKLAGVDAPAVEAVTVTAPVCVPAVTVGDVATPVESVVTVVGPPKVTVGGLPGGAKVTEALGMGLWKVSCTCAFSGSENAVPAAAL